MALPKETAVRISIETPADIREDIDRLFKAQWLETEQWRGTEYDPDIAYFQKLVDNNWVFTVTARRRSDEYMVGALMVTLFRDPLDQTICATERGFYVQPEYRGGTTAYRMAKAGLALLDKLPLSRVVFADKYPGGGEDLQRFFESLGFKMQARTYVFRPS